MIQDEVKEEMVEEQAAEPEDSVPEGEVEGQVAESGVLGLSWLPQKNQKKIVAAEKMINDILEKFPKVKLVRAKSPAQRFDLFYENAGKGQWAARVWFSGRTIDIHVPIRTGKKTTVESNIVTEAGFSKKAAGKIISGIGRYIKQRGWES